jgi:hypothetical protein
MSTANRLGFLSSFGLALVGLFYAIVVGFGIAEAGPNPIVDPALFVMEATTLLSAPIVVVWMAAIFKSAAPEREVFGVIALAFGAMMAALTSTVHFVALTAERQTSFFTLEWPSTLYAIELLAWDVFLGLALLFAAATFVGPGLFAGARWSLILTGVLCLLGAAGPLMGNMAVQRIGILGYGVVLPVCCVIVGLAFRRQGRSLDHYPDDAVSL